MANCTKLRLNDSVLELVEGDITKQDVDAIVNAANSTLLGGGGVDGAIHRAAGPMLLAETRTMGGCKTGNAKISKGYNLLARHVIHTVGPIYARSGDRAPELLANCYRRSLEVAVENGLETVAFPSISTGAYGYPIVDAADVALKTVAGYVQENPQIKRVRFVMFGPRAFNTFARAMMKLAQTNDAVSVMDGD